MDLVKIRTVTSIIPLVSILSLVTTKGYSTVQNDYRVILQPREWKIRDHINHATEIEYRFSLGLKWSEVDLTYPSCNQVACKGIVNGKRKHCEQVCATQVWHERNGLLQTAKYAYERAIVLLNTTFGDLAALIETHIPDPTLEKHISVQARAWEHRILIDVMKYHRMLLETILDNITMNNQHASFLVSPSTSTAKISVFELLDTWKTGVLNFAIQLDTLVHILREARLQLLRCAYAVQVSDLTSCQPGLIHGLYTDTPVDSHWHSLDRLVLIARRVAWNRVTLSFWYMPFIDSSQGDRICWLDRPMLNDTHSNYKVPKCNAQGVCEPLEIDNNILSQCEVNKDGEIGIDCHVICEGSCFGPICYNSESETYTPREIYPDQQKSSFVNYNLLFLTTKTPRILRTVQSLSQRDVNESYSRMLTRAHEASHLLQEGQRVLIEFIKVKSIAQKYIEKVTKSGRDGGEYEDEQRKLQYIAVASLTLSVLTCPIFLVLLIKIFRRTNVPGDKIPLMRSNRYHNIQHND